MRAVSRILGRPNRTFVMLSDCPIFRGFVARLMRGSRFEYFRIRPDRAISFGPSRPTDSSSDSLEFWLGTVPSKPNYGLLKCSRISVPPGGTTYSLSTLIRFGRPEDARKLSPIYYVCPVTSDRVTWQLIDLGVSAGDGRRPPPSLRALETAYSPLRRDSRRSCCNASLLQDNGVRSDQEP